MTAHPARIEGVVRISLAAARDERGESVKTFSSDRFAGLGLPREWSQTLVVKNHCRGTLRGMHWQADPHPERKLVHCLRGRVFDVLVDVRPASPTFGTWEGFLLGGEVAEALFIPSGVAHGYLTLEDGSDLLYQIDGEYRPEAQRVLRWDDATVAIQWPFEPLSIATRDAGAPRWDEIAGSLNP